MQEKNAVKYTTSEMDLNKMEKHKEEIENIILGTRKIIEEILLENRAENGDAYYDKFYTNLHRIVAGGASAVMMLSGIYDAGTEENEGMEEILGDFEKESIGESLDFITCLLMCRNKL